MLMRDIARRLGKIESAVLVALGVFAAATLMCLPAASQANDPAASDRRVITRVEPDYPETLKRLYIGGVVRVEAVVSPNGAVESTQLIGGNPILGQSAMKAIKQWKYVQANTKEKLLVRMEFDPHR